MGTANTRLEEAHLYEPHGVEEHLGNEPELGRGHRHRPEQQLQVVRQCLQIGELLFCHLFWLNDPIGKWLKAFKLNSTNMARRQTSGLTPATFMEN